MKKTGIGEGRFHSKGPNLAEEERFYHYLTIWALLYRQRDWNADHFVACTDGSELVNPESIAHYTRDTGDVHVID